MKNHTLHFVGAAEWTTASARTSSPAKGLFRAFRVRPTGLRRIAAGLAAFTLGLGALTAAQAAVVHTFDFTAASAGPESSLTFSSDTMGSNGVPVLTATAYQFSKGPFRQGFVTQQEGLGLGVSDGKGRDPLLDSAGPKDILVLSFGTDDWRPVSISFGAFEPTRDNYVVYGANEFDPKSLGGMINRATVLARSVQGAGPALDTVRFDREVERFRHYIVTTSFHPGDAFTVASFQGSVSAVPIPPSLALFATGLIGLGVLGWRRRRT